MNSNAICPISNKKVDENVARLNGGLTVGILSLFLISNNIFLILFLLVDFFLRSAELSAYSPLANLSKFILEKTGTNKKLINSGPKIFAARIGVIFNAAILISILVDLNTATYVLTAIFGICAFLEAAIGFCVACQIYPILYKLIYRTKNAYK